MEKNSVKIKFSLGHQVAKTLTPNSNEGGHLVFILPASYMAGLTIKNKVKEIKVEEIADEAFPFLNLSIKNQAEVYKIGKSFINDISRGHNQFGFASFVKDGDAGHLLAYGSFINYMLKRPVLVVVKDLNDKSWDKYRKNFSIGTLWKWKSHDWGNLCFIDYNQISLHSDSFNQLDFSVISNEFAATMWAFPVSHLSISLPKNALKILEKIKSITLTISKGKTLALDLKKAISHYQCFDIPVKGILIEGK